MRGRRLATLTACLVALAGVGAGAAATAQGPPANVDVSVLPNNDAEDAVAVNPTNPSNVVAMAITFTQSAGLIEGVSFNGGKTWTRQVIGSGTGDPLGDICCDEQLAWDRFGNLWMTYLLNSNGDVLVALSTNGGASFTKVADLQTKFGDQPSITVGPNSVWVSFTAKPGNQIQAFGAHGTGLGAFGPFTAPENVPSPGNGDYGDTAVGPSGHGTPPNDARQRPRRAGAGYRHATRWRWRPLSDAKRSRSSPDAWEVGSSRGANTQSLGTTSRAS